MAKTVQQMSAAEYKDWLLNNPDEAKKLDAPTAAPVVPTVVWRNGVAVQIADNSQLTKNGIVQ
jgi:hypothetical protein